MGPEETTMNKTLLALAAAIDNSFRFGGVACRSALLALCCQCQRTPQVRQERLLRCGIWAWLNSSNSLACSSGVMPMPVSETANSTKLLPLLTWRAASLISNLERSVIKDNT